MTDTVASEPLLDLIREPVTEDELRSHLAYANVPSLLMLLYQLTGDEKWLRPPYLPVKLLTASPDDDDTGGLPPDRQAEVREVALAALLRWYVGEPFAIPAPGGAELLRMMSVCVGEPVPETYVPMIAAQLRFDPVPVARPAPDVKPTDFSVLVVGAGISGLVMAYRLKRAGIPFRVFERHESVGGVWQANRYPGAGVDTANEMYSFSFFPRNWSMYYSKRDEMLKYFNDFADQFGLRDYITFNTEVTRLEFDEAAQRWHVTYRACDKDNGGGAEQTLDANVVVSAMGIFAEPKVPPIKDLDTFEGPIFHSSRWPADLDVTGKRVAVIGTGASAMQIVPAIADSVAAVHVFQRTPPWITPAPKYFLQVPASQHWLNNHVPFYREWVKFRMAWLSYERLLPSLVIDPEWPHPERAINAINDRARENLTKYIHSQLADRDDLVAKTVPAYPAFGKRMLLDNGWYAALRKPAVELVAEEVAAVDASGVICPSGQRRGVDVIVLATGFQTTRYLGPVDVIGRGGRELHEAWGDDNAEAYLSFMTPGFPNLLITYGPNSQGSGGSFTLSAELQTNFVVQMIVAMLDHDLGTVEPRADVFDAYIARIDGLLKKMIWSHPNVETYYNNRHGRVVVPRPYSVVDWWHLLRRPRLGDYATEPRRRSGRQTPAA
jgi:4-hydroxyacetophenone monooxygenase